MESKFSITGNELQQPKFGRKSMIKYITGVVAYLLLLNLHERLDVHFEGIIAQINALVSIYLTLEFKKLGYITSLVLNALQVCLVIMSIIFQQHMEFLPGIIVTGVVILIITIIYFDRRKLSDRMTEIIQQKNELAEIYGKLKTSEEELSKKNDLLEKNNEELQANAKKINKLVFFDSLTGLPNRIQIINHLELLSISSKHSGAPFTLIMMRINDFKQVNDALGHMAGDQVLKSIGRELSTTINSNDLLGRFGDTEFAVVISRIISERKLHLYIEQLKAALSRVTSVNQNKVSVTARFGIAAFPKDTSDHMELIKYADTAVHMASPSGRNSVLYFNNHIKVEVTRKKEFETQLLSSIEKEELYLVYQPQFRANDKCLRGFEALVRWKSEVYGEISPMQFISIAEENGFIIPMGKWILQTACTKFREFLNETGLKAIISVNISARQIMDPGFIDMVKTTLEQTGLPARCLELELTESIMIDEVDYVSMIMKALRMMGVTVALDDFGTGYSSLSLLPRLPVDTLKIDRTFIKDIEIEEKKSHLIDAIISIAHKMRFYVIAEGIETVNQLEFLKLHKCDCIQGYLWGKPGQLPDAESIKSGAYYSIMEQKEQAV